MISLLLLSVQLAPDAAGCAVVGRGVERGTALTTADLRSSQTCPAHPQDSGLVVDRQGVIRARRNLEQGSVVAITGRLLPIVKQGDRLYLQSRRGAIIVERPVTALQEGRPGRHIFVRTSDGQVASARLPSERPQ